MLKGFSAYDKRLKAIEKKTAPPKTIVLNLIFRNGNIRNFLLKK